MKVALRLTIKSGKKKALNACSFVVVCADDENYADKCPEMAAIKDYCKHQSDFMQKNCPKSCGFCSSGKTE